MTKLLFLPHCLNKKSLKILKQGGEKRNYKIHIVRGGSIVKKILKTYPKIEKSVGVACEDQINLAINYTKHLKDNETEIKSIQLSQDGCKNAEVNLENVLNNL